MISGIGIASFLKSNKSIIINLGLVSALILLMLFLQILGYPQDVGKPTITKIVNSIRATNQYKEIRQEDFTSYNRQQQIVYNAKYNKSNNQEYYLLYDNGIYHKKTITAVNGQLVANNELLSLIQEEEKSQEMIQELINQNSREIGKWSVRKFDNDYIGYEIILDKINRRKTIDNKG